MAHKPHIARMPKIHRISIDTTDDLVAQLKNALVRRAAQEHGDTTTDPDFSIKTWFLEEARKLIEKYNK